MERPATAAPFSSFAGLLASLTSSSESPGPEPDADGMADDVAQLSYESALRMQRHTACAPEPDLAPESGRDSQRISGAGPDLPAGNRRVRDERITLRLSRAESVQLRARAAESGLTVSAYLRTCILEVESLRTQVKDALEQMRAPESPATLRATEGPTRVGPVSAPRWTAKLFRWKSGERAESA